MTDTIDKSKVKADLEAWDKKLRMAMVMITQVHDEMNLIYKEVTK